MFSFFYIQTGEAMHNTKFLRTVGQPCRLELPTPGAPGLGWFAELAEAAHGPVSVTLEDSLQHTGEGRRQAFVLVGQAAGDYELRFVLRRAWSPEIRDAHRVLLQVRSTCSRPAH
jgi:hypothetical protein